MLLADMPHREARRFRAGSFAYAGLSNGEIARCLDTSVGTIRIDLAQYSNIPLGQRQPRIEARTRFLAFRDESAASDASDATLTARVDHYSWEFEWGRLAGSEIDWLNEQLIEAAARAGFAGYEELLREAEDRIGVAESGLPRAARYFCSMPPPPAVAMAFPPIKYLAAAVINGPRSKCYWPLEIEDPGRWKLQPEDLWRLALTGVRS